MTYTVRVRGDSTARITLEWLCPEHYRFATNEPRSTAPDARPCPECGATSPQVISAPSARVRIAEAIRGPSQERPPNALDTRPLAEGMSYGEWSKKQKKLALDEKLRQVRRMRA